MRISLALVCWLALLAPSPSAAAVGMNLAWSSGPACPTGPGAYADYADPCDGSGFQYLIGSVVPPEGPGDRRGSLCGRGVRRVRRGLALCRRPHARIPDRTRPDDCNRFWGASTVSTFNWASLFGGWSNHSRLSFVAAIPPSEAAPMTAGRQYYAFKAALTTTQATTCSACQVPACLVFRRLKLVRPPGVGDFDLLELSATRNWATWYGGVGVNGGCPGATPARRSSWGQMKSLYR